LEAHKSRYKLALIDLWQRNTDKAHHQFLSLAEKPDGPLAPEAKAMSDYISHQKDKLISMQTRVF
jgi:hypothetical protein